MDQMKTEREGIDALAKHIQRARMEALKNGIEANVVAIDKGFARVKGFPMMDLNAIYHVPDMICGLQVLFDDLPVEGHAFWVFHSDQAQAGRLRQLEEENAALREQLQKVRELIEKHDV